MIKTIVQLLYFRAINEIDEHSIIVLLRIKALPPKKKTNLVIFLKVETYS